MSEPEVRVTTSAAALVPSPPQLSRRDPKELSIEEHVELLQRLRRVSLVQSVVAGSVGGAIGVLAPAFAVLPALMALFIVGRAMRRRRMMPYQRILTEYGIDGDGEDRLREAWRHLRARGLRRAPLAERATIVFRALQAGRGAQPVA